MMDWADEIANQILDGSDHEALTIFASESDRVKIAAALRKAKADGMREAVEIVDMAPQHLMQRQTLDYLRARAAEIEKGQA